MVLKQTRNAGLPPSLSMNDGVAMICLNRPAQHNRLDPDDLSVIVGLIADACHDISTRLLVITGAGQTTFCSGYTLDAIIERLDDRFEAMLEAVASCPVPTLAAINGSAYGGGTDLALCCDFRIAVAVTDTGPLQAMMPAAQFGLHYHPSGLARYVAQMGLSAAKKLVLTGQTMGADELLANGFLTELVGNHEALKERINAYAHSLSVCEPAVVSSMKLQMDCIAADAASSAAKDRSQYIQSLLSNELSVRVNRRLNRDKK